MAIWSYPIKGKQKTNTKKIMEATIQTNLTDEAIESSSTFAELRYRHQVNFLHSILREESAKLQAMRDRWAIIDAIGMDSNS